MGQSLSRRPAPPTGPGHGDDTHPPRRSLPRRILSFIPKPSLRSRPLSASLTLPTRPEQTLRGKNRRWRLSRRHNVPSDTQTPIPEHMDPLAEHDENQVDRDVDELGLITHRVPDSHSDSPAGPAKGKEKAKDIPDIEVENEDNDEHPIPSTSSTLPLAQSGAGCDHDPAEAVTPPTHPPSPPAQPSPLPPPQESEPLAPLPSISIPAPPSQPSAQANTSPRPFPPPGTLVVVQGVVHTTDVPRSSDHSGATSNPVPPSTVDALNSNTNTGVDTGSTRPSSVPPGTRSRNPLTGILPRPSSMVPAVPSSSPSDLTIGSSNIDTQARQTISNAGGPAEDIEDEDRTHTHPHGISIAQGPVGASGLSASSIDVLGTLLSVAAAATAASLLTGSSEPIFSSGLTSSPPPPSSGSISHVPSERPLSPTPTSDAGRMRHVWSSLRDRLGLGSGAHNSNHSTDTTSSVVPGQSTPSQPSGIVRPRDPREIMLAEMARAFNLGLGLGGASTNSPDAPTNANTTELAMPNEGGDVLAGGRDEEQPSQPPPDSFERFLMDLQADLRVTLMQEHEPGVVGGTPPDADETAEDIEDDQPIPELQSISDSDSEELGTNSDERDELDGEDNVDHEGDEEEEHPGQDALSGRASPAVSALGAGTCYPFGVRTGSGSPSFGVSGIAPPRAGHPLPIPTAVFPSTGGEISASNPVLDSRKTGDVGAAHASSSVSIGPDGSSPREVRFEEESKRQGEGAVLGMAHSQEASNGEPRVQAEGCRAVSGTIAVPPLDIQDPSNVAVAGTGRESPLLGTSSLSGPSTSDTHNPASSTTQASTQSPTPTLLPPSDPEPTTQNSSPNPTSGDSSMPFRLPFTPSSASRTEHTPGGGINWWRMYRFPAIATPNLGQPWGPQGPSPLSQSTFRPPVQGPTPSSTDSWTRTLDHNQQNEMMTSLGVPRVPGVHSGLAAPSLTPSATPPNMPENVSASSQSSTPPSTNGQEFSPLTNTSNTSPEHRNNVVVPVIVVGLQSVNMDRQHPHIPHPHANHGAATDEDGEGVEFDGLEHPMSMPLHIPEPPEFRHHSGPPSTIHQQEHGSQQPARGRTWQSRAANAIRNLRPSRRNADAASPQPQETPGSRTFLIYVIGGYYPPDHQIITGGNLDSFEALWQVLFLAPKAEVYIALNRELAELLGQVKPPTASKEEIEKSGLEIINASMLEEYEGQGRVASNCIDRCLICLDDYDPEDELRVLTCKHTFHRGCVDKWLETGRNNCPACRTKGVGNENAGAPTASTTV